MKKIAIIILNYNGQKYLKDLIESLERDSYTRQNSELIFVNNKSDDGSLEYLEELEGQNKISLIKNKENLGFAEGNNVGARYALEKGHKYIVCLNQDTEVEEGWLEELVRVAKSDSRIAIVQPRLMLYPNKQEVNSLGNQYHFLGFGQSAGGYQKYNSENYSEPSEILGYATGAAFLARAEFLEKFGVFDKEFFAYHEDTDLNFKAKIAGYKIFLAPNSVVYHKYEFSRSIDKYYYMEKNRYLLLLSYLKIPTLLLISPAFFCYELGIFGFSFFNGFWKEKLKAYLSILYPSSIIYIIKKRKEIRKIRKIQDREFTRDFVGKIEFQEIMNPALKYIANPIFSLYWWVIKKLIIW